MYADDTSVLLNGRNIKDLIETLNIELQLLNIWLKANKLTVNVQKTYYLLFHRSRIKLNDPLPNVCINMDNLNRTDCFKYLGVILDSKVSWIQHITYVKNKVSKGIDIMYKARKYLNKQSLINLYYSFIYPYLIYCIESWGNATDCHLNQLFLMQKRVVRLITFSDYNVPTTTIFQAVNILPLQKIVYDRIGIMMYKYANGLLPQVMNDLYITNNEIHSYPTRHQHLLHINKSSINVYSKSFANTSARIWNALQSKMNVHVSISNFKLTLKCYLQNNTLNLTYQK